MITSPVVLLILDGWGLTRNTRGNAIYDAYTPVMDRIAGLHPSLALAASGFAVGMLWGEPGNSATGHAALGTGRITYNHLPRILREIRNGGFFENPVLLGAVAHVRKHHSRLHVIGLLSGATMHSYSEHLHALFELAGRTATPAFLHVFTDGKDSASRQGLRVLEEAILRIQENGYPITPATIMGRYYAMDQTTSWDRIERAWKLLVVGEGVEVSDLAMHLRQEYAKGVTDEFITPAFTKAERRIQENDAVIFFNFREDGMRELAEAFARPEFNGFSRDAIPNVYIATFTEYAKELPVGVAFPAPAVQNALSEVLSRHGVKQLKIAESQKIAHLSYFFSGGREEAYTFENRTIFPPDVSRPNEPNPAMHAEEISQEVARAVERTAHEFIVANFANADTLGHSGNYSATIRAVESIDQAIDKIYQAIIHHHGALLITSDHGGAEDLFNTRTGEIKTGHSDNPVPFHFVTPRNRFHAMRTAEELRHRYTQPMGVLADVAPTVLELLGVKKPAEMTGRSLLGLL